MTEVGSNYYLFMPVLAALAKAKKIMAWSCITEYGDPADIIIQCGNILNAVELRSKVDFILGRIILII